MLVPQSLEDIFPFFADAANLQRITPPWLDFEVLTPAVQMKPGQHLDYRLRIRKIPVRWTSAITVWEPPLRFVDEQVRGPYRIWRHEHRFTAQGGGTLCEDEVLYAVPGGAWVNRLLVEPDVKRIFEYRKRRLGEIFGPK